ncbi:Uncharacterised protein [Candidatus Bilamarchaeum dharawalense]|uniref:Elp3/MiaA/NifB-like radical SAM core domain-containing protein n=1 Tax=Candidatus Bilamarchaeum dharawalense TaxID=2885759 RepID=A0A5E4LP65_9ARCH|nr:Uncharacterised protein [Candidatus Bilamarchaeum dharawalense]
MSDPNHYPPSIRPALVRRQTGVELFVTLKTRNCSRAEKNGRCDFCGLGLLDGNSGSPLHVSEAETQIYGMLEDLRKQGVNPQTILKLSLISMSDSLLNPKTIQPAALYRTLELLRHAFSGILEVSIESRADMIEAKGLIEVGQEITRLFGIDSRRQIACGIETADEDVRLSTGKGITNLHIYEAATILGQEGFGLRGYFIYNMFEHTLPTRRLALMEAINFMVDITASAGVQPSILILRGYVPADKQDHPRFRKFSEVSDEIALRDLRLAAVHAKSRRLTLEVDTTVEDQQSASAILEAGVNILSPRYINALRAYNLSFDPNCLR